MWNQMFGVGDLDGDAFVALVAREGVRSGDLVEPRVDAEDMTIRDASGLVLTLGDLHDQFLELPKRERIEFVREHVRQAVRGEDVPEGWADARDLVMPKIRSSADLVGDVPVVPNRRMAPGLHVTIVAKLPARILRVTDAHLAAWDVSFDNALVVAHRNLVQRVHPVLPLSPGLWMIHANDDFAASRVLMPSLLRRLCSKPVVALQDQHCVMVADSTNRGAVQALLRTAGSEEDEPITRRLYELHEKQLREWTPNDDGFDPSLLCSYFEGIEKELRKAR